MLKQTKSNYQPNELEYIVHYEKYVMAYLDTNYHELLTVVDNENYQKLGNPIFIEVKNQAGETINLITWSPNLLIPKTQPTYKETIFSQLKNYILNLYNPFYQKGGVSC